MHRYLLAALAALCTCSTVQKVETKLVQAAQTPAGALFCEIHTVAGPILANVVTAVSSGNALVALATNAAKADVDATCAAAAVAADGVSGTAVAPPPDLTTPIVQVALGALLTPSTTVVSK